MDSPKGRPKHRRRILKVRRLFSSPELLKSTREVERRLLAGGDNRIATNPRNCAQYSSMLEWIF